MYLIFFVFSGEIIRLTTDKGINIGKSSVESYLNYISVCLYGTSCGSTMITTNHEVCF